MLKLLVTQIPEYVNDHLFTPNMLIFQVLHYLGVIMPKNVNNVITRLSLDKNSFVLEIASKMVILPYKERGLNA